MPEIVPMPLRGKAWLLPIALLALAGCGSRDPYRRTDVWQPTGSNAANLAAMVANPNDLRQGRGVTRIGTIEPAAAVNRLWTDNPRPLAPSASTGAGSGAPASSGSAGGVGGLPSVSPPGN